MTERLQRQIQIELEERREGATQTTFSAVLSTESPVERFNGYQTFDEVLRHSPDAIDLSRAPLPLIESHNQRSLPIGVIENLRIEGKRLRGTVRFGSSQRAQEVARDVADKIITGISIGYTIDRYEDREERGKVTRVATRWVPHEGSVVAIPADIHAGFGRSSGESRPMPEENQAQSQPPETRSQPDEHSRGALEERARIDRIQEACRAVGLDETFTRDLVSSGSNLDQAREKIFAELIRRSEESPGPRGSVIVTGGDRLTESRNAIVKDVVECRMGSLELARTVLQARGEKVPTNSRKLIERAMSTSDFPSILDATVGAALRKGFESEPASHREWIRPEPVDQIGVDQKRPILSGAPSLQKVNEGGEYSQGSMDEDTTAFKVEKFGRIVSLTWETLVNDRLGAFARMIPALGQAARRGEADLVYSRFAENSGNGPTMQDSNPLFDSVSHKNVTSAFAALDASALAAGRLLLRKQTGQKGENLSLVPVTLLVPAEEEDSAERLLAAASRVISSTLESDVTPWVKNLNLVVEPRLAATAAFLVADSAQVDHFVLGLLEENMSGPYVETKDGFERDEKLWKIRHVFGAKALDWRGIVKIDLTG